MRSKRPWKKYGRILRIETNGGDVRYYAECEGHKLGYGAWGYRTLGTFESLNEAEKALAEWWAEWWPRQEKSRRAA